MKKRYYPVLLTLTFFSIGGCSTYNSFMPDWATIGNSDVANLEAKMEDAVDSLDFEEAARLRDEIRKIETAIDTSEPISESKNNSTWWNPLSWW